MSGTKIEYGKRLPMMNERDIRLRPVKPVEIRFPKTEKEKSVFSPYISAAVDGTLAFYDPEKRSFMGHVKYKESSPNDTVYNKVNLSALVAARVLAEAYQKKVPGITLDHLIGPCEFLYSEKAVINGQFAGIRDDLIPDIFTKYTAEYVKILLGVSDILKSKDDSRHVEYLDRAKLFGDFLLEAQKNGFASTYNTEKNEWQDAGWHTPGRSIEALSALSDKLHTTHEEKADYKQQHILEFGNKLIALYKEKEGPYFRSEKTVDGVTYYFDSDIFPSEMSGLMKCYELCKNDDVEEAEKYLGYANKMAAWISERQTAAGGFPVRVKEGQDLGPVTYKTPLCERLGDIKPGSPVEIADAVSPGDSARITSTLLDLYAVTGDKKLEPVIMDGLYFCMKTLHLDPTKLTFGMCASWLNMNDVDNYLVSADNTYAPDQIPWLLELFLKADTMIREQPELFSSIFSSTETAGKSNGFQDLSSPPFVRPLYEIESGGYRVVA